MNVEKNCIFEYSCMYSRVISIHLDVTGSADNYWSRGNVPLNLSRGPGDFGVRDTRSGVTCLEWVNKLRKHPDESTMREWKLGLY